MNKKTETTAISRFLKHARKEILNGSNACYYHHIAEGLYVVVADTEDGPTAKIAYNCDSMQSDYEFDWLMPQYKDANVVFVEISLENKVTRADAAYLYDEAKFILKLVKSGKVVDWCE